MALDGTTINYNDVLSVANNLDSCREKMSSQFEEWTSIMNHLTNSDTFYGSASDAYHTSFAETKRKFDEYTRLVADFATTLRSQSERYQQTDAEMAKAAEQVNNGF